MAHDVNIKQVFRTLLAGCLAALLVCSPAAAAPSEQEALAVGSWYGEFAAGANQPLQRFLTTRFADGTYTLLARMYDKGRMMSELRNSGLWGVSNGLYFTFTTEIDGKRTDPRGADLSNPYLIRNLAVGAFEYQHIPSGRIFRVMRVDPTTRLPD